MPAMRESVLFASCRVWRVPPGKRDRLRDNKSERLETQRAESNSRQTKKKTFQLNNYYNYLAFSSLTAIKVYSPKYSEVVYVYKLL